MLILVKCWGHRKNYEWRLDLYFEHNSPDHLLNPPTPHRPCMEQQDQTEVEIPPSGEGTLSPGEVPLTTPQESNTPEAPQIQEPPQEGSEPRRSYADVARTPPSPEPEGASPQPAAEGPETGSTPRRSTRSRRETKRYITEC